MVSIVMPAFNSEKTIAESINSIIKQTYKDWELIVVDDGSTDTTVSIVTKYQETNKNIRCISNSNKKGVSGARNSGIMAAKGTYIAFLDSDDIWLEHHLQECIETLERFNYQICSALWLENVYGNIIKIGESGWFDYIFNDMQNKLGINRNEKYWKFDKRLFQYIVESEFYCFHINTVVVKKSLIEKVGGFNEKMQASEDLDVMYKMLQYENIVTINDYHFIYNYGQNNIYAFCNRGESLEKELTDRKMLEKLALNVKGKIQLNTRMKSLVKKSDVISNKEELINLLNKKIYERSMTYVWLNKRYHIWTSIWMFIKTMRFLKFKSKEERYFHSDYRKEHLHLD